MGHTYADVLVHVIFSTKGRQPTIHESFRQRMYEYICGIGRKEFGGVLSIGGTDNSNRPYGLLLGGGPCSTGSAARGAPGVTRGYRQTPLRALVGGRAVFHGLWWPRRRRQQMVRAAGPQPGGRLSVASGDAVSIASGGTRGRDRPTT